MKFILINQSFFCLNKNTSIQAFNTLSSNNCFFFVNMLGLCVCVCVCYGHNSGG